MQGRKSLKPDMFVGSGTVEAGCNAIVGQRLKLSGMRWSGPGATNIITLRCQHDSTHHNQTTAAQPPHTTPETCHSTATYKSDAHPNPGCSIPMLNPWSVTNLSGD
ncbi:UNVERIFIED_ORG: hypothetical protein ABIB52_003351 [Arthrobacter sp. UYCu721]